MKALSIHQPFTSLIANGEKFVENRSWATFYRGPLAIHASKGSRYLTTKELREYPTGCVVAIADLVGCVPVNSLAKRIRQGFEFPGMSLGLMQRVLEHEHTEGPYGWVLQNVVKLDEPIPFKGAQGLFEFNHPVANVQA